MWVDPETPHERYTWKTSRGHTWDLVMSDEFNTPGRSFRPGDDHLWTSIEKPDGVNDAMEIYAHNKTTTACDKASSVCSFQIELEDAVIQLQVWNSYLQTPGFENFYRGGMVQSWNKFCIQGGMIEVRAQLPGALTETSGNPDILLDSSARARSLRYYPTWPGIWMMGNLGRAIFSGSTNRMWPFSYDACDPDTLTPTNQRISACDADPGSGMNPHQGRGAPEIDIVEGGGTTISSSIQVGPGMPPDFRVIPPAGENKLCIYSSSCETLGANIPGIPESVYLGTRGHQSWYQNMRYAANNFCQRNISEVQSYTKVEAALTVGIEDNMCSVTTCPASLDINSDLDYMNAEDHLDEYEDEENKLVEVHGKAFCRTDADCTVQTAHSRRRNSTQTFSDRRSTVVLTGRCVNKRCECSSKSWAGPRCIVPTKSSAVSFGPPAYWQHALDHCFSCLGLLRVLRLFCSKENQGGHQNGGAKSSSNSDSSMSLCDASRANISKVLGRRSK
ncbi:hypothetical protein AM588_10000722 [Phytophthora nicotianae]|uniref:Beta-glucan synthesis-associated protein SKN1 n=1 Tax=Phytophthora nicotianae TaxID=4792 RepID=A0A0W8CK79_PHYNI|nr:hypothetical protein AM588_10000722 [Phytophthora nicotianae]